MNKWEKCLLICVACAVLILLCASFAKPAFAKGTPKCPNNCGPFAADIAAGTICDNNVTSAGYTVCCVSGTLHTCAVFDVQYYCWRGMGQNAVCDDPCGTCQFSGFCTPNTPAVAC
jgi:hypothetical protein